MPCRANNMLMDCKFNIIEELSGLTRFVFDKALLVRVARECGVLNITNPIDFTKDRKEACEILLLKSVILGPYMTASSTNQHGAWTKTVGAEQLDSNAIDRILSRLRFLCKKHGDSDTLEEVESQLGYMEWINEEEC